MASFIVTFKIKSDSNYQSRYDSFVKKINEISGYSHWDETTSFYCFKADSTVEDVRFQLVIDSEFDPSRDTV